MMAFDSINFVKKYLTQTCKNNVVLYYFVRKYYYILVQLFKFPHEREFEILRQMPLREGIILDVGANDGISAYSIRLFNKSNPILSIEPNTVHAKSLARTASALENVDVQFFAAGREQGEVILYVPIYSGFPLTSCASLFRQEAEDLPRNTLLLNGFNPRKLKVLEIMVPVRRIDDLELQLVFVKLDVQGAELMALQGMEKTLRSSRPIILLERSEANVSSVIDFLTRMQYELVAASTALPITVDEALKSYNLVFWPKGLPRLGLSAGRQI